MSSWGCPHECNGKCARVNDARCDPGMKGCVLFGRFVFANQLKNRPAGGWGSNEPEPPAQQNNTPSSDKTDEP